MASEVFHSRIAHQRDNGRTGLELFGESQSGDDISARRGAREKALLARQAPGHGYGLFRRDLVNPVGDALFPERYDKAGADTIDLVTAGPAT